MIRTCGRLVRNRLSVLTYSRRRNQSITSARCDLSVLIVMFRYRFQVMSGVQFASVITVECDYEK
jgi:hypothetical protein